MCVPKIIKIELGLIHYCKNKMVQFFASSVNDFKNKLDAHWSNQEMVCNYRVEISGTGSRSIFQ